MRTDNLRAVGWGEEGKLGEKMGSSPVAAYFLPQELSSTALT